MIRKIFKGYHESLQYIYNLKNYTLSKEKIKRVKEINGYGNITMLLIVIAFYPVLALLFLGYYILFPFTLIHESIRNFLD